MSLDARAERPHAAGVEIDWSERWTFTVRSDDGTSGTWSLSYVPNAARASWLTQLDVPGIGLVVVRDDELAMPRHPASLTVRGDGLWAELVCETPFEHWSIGMEAFGLRVDDLSEDVGERLPVGLDLEWEVAGDAPVVERADETADGYEQHGTVHGELLVASDRIPFDGTGTRAHTWGTTGP